LLRLKARGEPEIGGNFACTGRKNQMTPRAVWALPGHCLLCFGGLHDELSARQVLASAEAERTFFADRDWQHERAGSLASLNQCAAAVALRLLEDLVAERVEDSTWTHIEFDPAGHLTVSYPTPPPRTAASLCHVCGVSGWGEEGLPRMVEVFRLDRS